MRRAITVAAVMTLMASTANRAAAGVAAGAQDDRVSVPLILDRAADYLMAFEKDYSKVIADERYRQTLTEKRVRVLGDKTAKLTREIRSDLLATTDTGDRWLSFRDVYSVDGRPVRDRDDRLEKVFALNGKDRFEQARRIADEGARFNLGSLERNVNLPSMSLTFLTRENRSRSSFRVAGRDRIHDVPVVILEFEETSRPTMVKSGSRNLPAVGKFWIEPDTGRVMKSYVKFETRDFLTEMTVLFSLDEKLKMWVPAEMIDKAENSKEIVDGLAVYTNYRRFDTNVIIK